MKTPTLPVPFECSEGFSMGWSFADDWLRQGGSPEAESPDGQTDDWYCGFFARCNEAKLGKDIQTAELA